MGGENEGSVQVPSSREGARRSSVSQRLEQAADANVLVIYTGGTIGMMPTDDGYAPAPNFLKEYLKGLPQCHEAGFPELTLPLSRYGKRIQYEILEYEPLLDSCNIGMDDWLRISNDIEKHYDKYEAFVVLHGTDTMAYTASALSFLCENLTKTVVITGSQVPMALSQSDGMANFLGALTVAGHFCIPEVGLYFNNRLLRGNRCRKVDASGFDAFDTPNYAPLVTLGTSLDVHWHRIRSGSHGAQFRVAKAMSRDVTTLRLFPGMTLSTVEHIFSPPIKGVILETFGAGNGPDSNQEFLNILTRAHERGIVIANCTQCIKGAVSGAYKTGVVLRRAGVVPCLDMTTEAALTKLAYLLSRYEQQEDVEQYMQSNIRGEITMEEKAKFSLNDNDFIRKIAEAMSEAEGTNVDKTTNRIVKALGPVLLCSSASQGDTDMLERLIYSRVDPSASDYDSRSPMHLAAANGKIDALSFLISKGGDVNALDRWMGTPLLDAIIFGHDDCAQMLQKHSGYVVKSEFISRLLRAASEGDAALVERLCKFGGNPSDRDYDKRTALHIAAATGNEEIINILLSHGAEVNALDRWLSTPLDDALKQGNESIINILRDAGATHGSGAHSPRKHTQGSAGNLKQSHPGVEYDYSPPLPSTKAKKVAKKHESYSTGKKSTFVLEGHGSLADLSRGTPSGAISARPRLEGEQQPHPPLDLQKTPYAARKGPSGSTVKKRVTGKSARGVDDIILPALSAAKKGIVQQSKA